MLSTKVFQILGTWNTFLNSVCQVLGTWSTFLNSVFQVLGTWSTLPNSGSNHRSQVSFQEQS